MKLLSNLLFSFLLPLVALASDNRDVRVSAATVLSELESFLGPNTTLFNMYTSIDAFILGDFKSEPNTQRFNGSLAIQGNFTATNFNINSNKTSIQCSSGNSTMMRADYGLVVGGVLNAANSTVNGAAFYTSGDTSGIATSNSCTLSAVNMTANATINTTTNVSAISEYIDFNGIKQATLNMSQYFSAQSPNMVIRDEGFLTDGHFTGNDNQEYYVYTFDKCENHTCTLPSYLYSSPEQIFLGGNWTGPYNSVYPVDKTIVFNIPVLTDSVFNMSTANPAAGLEGAEVVYNIYPVQRNGTYNPTGCITVIRNTAYPLTGTVLAPNAYFIENNNGGINGKLIASRYLSVLDISIMKPSANQTSEPITNTSIPTTALNTGEHLTSATPINSAVM